MLRQAKFGFTCALLSIAMLLAAPVVAAGDTGTRLRLSNVSPAKLAVPLGESRVFTTGEDITRLVIGNQSIADVVLVSPRSFYVLGQNLGQTNLQVFGNAQIVMGLVDLEVTVDTADLAGALRSAVPGADIRVESINGRVRLNGHVPDAIALERALKIASQYGSSEVVNALQIASPQQVFLEVRMIEASRDAGKSLGISVNASKSGSEGGGSLISGRGLNGDNIPFGSFLASLISDGLNIDLLLQALEERGLARNLAQPTLAALSGETASFLAGGEVPIPVAEDDGKVTIEFKEFGVRLSFTPIVLNNGLINLTLEPEVSQVDFANTFDTGLIELPSFTTRRAKTTIELKDGQSFAMAGLLQRNNTRRQQQIPWLGDVPILGTLFRSASFQKDETDLVIIVTPRLSRPAAPSLIKTPLDYSVVTSEKTFFLYGIQEISRVEMTRELKKRGIDAPFGHVINDDYVAGSKYD